MYVILADNSVAILSLVDFDLSECKSLTTLEVTAGTIDRALEGGSSDAASELLKYALSTIQSPNFALVVLLYQEHNFRGVQTGWDSEWPHLHEMSQIEKAEEASRHRARFKLMREMHKIRSFRLELCPNAWDPVGEYVVRELKEAVAAEKGYDDSFTEPPVIYNPHWDLWYGVAP
jgi:hypothetical protein